MMPLGMPFNTQLRQSESKMINQVINFVPKIIGTSLCFCVIHGCMIPHMYATYVCGHGVENS